MIRRIPLRSLIQSMKDSDKTKAGCGYIPLFYLSAILPIIWLVTKPSPFLKAHAIRSLILQAAIAAFILVWAPLYPSIPRLLRVIITPIPVIAYLVLTVIWMIQAFRGIPVRKDQETGD